MHQDTVSETLSRNSANLAINYSNATKRSNIEFENVVRMGSCYIHPCF